MSSLGQVVTQEDEEAHNESIALLKKYAPAKMTELETAGFAPKAEK